MQKLSKNEMKTILGGQLAPKSCLVSCGAWEGGATGSYKSGTCTAGSVTVNGTSMQTCECSVSGGNCYPA
jgi:hypothetical protein